MKTDNYMHPALRRALEGFVTAGPAPAPTRPEPGRAAAVPHEEDTIEQLQQKMLEAHERSQALRATADAEHRGLNEEESKEIDDLSEQFDELDAEVKRRERLIAQREKLNQPQPRKSQPVDAPATEAAGRPRITGGEFVGASKNSWGWRSMGEFAKAVIAAGQRGTIDPRITAAATTYGNEATPADGGFAVPPDFRETIVKQLQGEESLLARTDQLFTSSNKITVPVDATTPWQTANGILATWEGEAAAVAATKPQLGQVEVKANKMMALVPLTDELMEDVPALSRYLPGKVADKFTAKLNEAIINGDGVGKPQGLLNSPSLVTVEAEGEQDETVMFANIVKMYARLYGPLRAGAVWLINQDVEPQLYSMTVPGTQPAFPAYMPPGGLSGNPYATLLGRPVISLEACQALGLPGDIILVNLQQYMTVQKVGGIRQDVSMHLYFDQAITAFRFIMRVGGQSWWASKATRAHGSSNEVSNVVVLADRT